MKISSTLTYNCIWAVFPRKQLLLSKPHQAGLSSQQRENLTRTFGPSAREQRDELGVLASAGLGYSGQLGRSEITFVSMHACECACVSV